jgi:uncharacterized protein (UPF0333 family)
MIYYKKGQSVLEYSILIAVILSALVIMQFYIKRGYQGRLKKESDTVGQQYSPGHTESTLTTHTESISSTTVADGKQIVSISGPSGKAKSVVTRDEHVDAFSKE